MLHRGKKPLRRQEHATCHVSGAAISALPGLGKTMRLQ
jgi:hypothetical protein